jgi:hypothetical protein
MNNKSYQIVNNSLINNNIKNKMQIPSTPNQINKFSIKNNMNNTYLTQTPLIDAKNGNIIMNNNARQFGNSVGMNKNKSNDGLDQNQKKSLENYRKFLSQLDQNLPNPKP